MIKFWKRRPDEDIPPTEPVRIELGPSRRAEVIRLLAEDKRVEAVKAVRVGTDLSLLLAVRTVDEVAAKVTGTGVTVQVTITVALTVDDAAPLRAAVRDLTGETSTGEDDRYSSTASDVEVLVDPSRLLTDLPGVRLIDSATSAVRLGSVHG